MNTQEIVNEISVNGRYKVGTSVEIVSSESMIEDQKGWHDSDESKHKDFSKSPFWVLTSDGETVGHDTIEEALESI